MKLGLSEQPNAVEGVVLTPPNASDGAALWQLVGETGVLDANSPYLYLLIGAHFRDTSVIARRGDDVVGMITGYLPPHPLTAPSAPAHLRATDPASPHAPRAGADMSPDAPRGGSDILFVWQVGVAERARGLGVASAMLNALLERPACAGVRWVETTVSPDNRASRAMFESLARRLGTACVDLPCFDRALFPPGGGAHDEERLLRIGPFTPAAAAPPTPPG